MNLPHYRSHILEQFLSKQVSQFPVKCSLKLVAHAGGHLPLLIYVVFTDNTVFFLHLINAGLF